MNQKSKTLFHSVYNNNLKCTEYKDKFNKYKVKSLLKEKRKIHDNSFSQNIPCIHSEYTPRSCLSPTWLLALCKYSLC